MKNLTTTKKSVLVITLSLVIILFVVILATTCTPSASAIQNSPKLYADSNSIVGDDGTSMFADTVEGINKDAYIMNDVFPTCLLAAAIFQNKSDVYEVLEMEPPEKVSQLYPANLSQSYYNALLYDYYGIKATGTCSLIAMLIGTDALGINDKIDLSWANCKTEEERNVAMLKELYDISIKYDNSYDSASRGTKRSTIASIIEEFYANHGYYFNYNAITLKDDLRKNVQNRKVDPALLSISNALTQDDYEVGPHTVALVGSYKIRLKYKKLKYGIPQWGDFNAFVICDGWTNSNDGSLGDNYQILIFNTNVVNPIQLVNLR